MLFKENKIRSTAWHKASESQLSWMSWVIASIGRWIQARLEDYPQKNTISLLDGVRACACLIVIWYHIYQIPRDLQVWHAQPFTSSLLNAFLYSGKFGVTLFFVLSGFLLFMPFAKALLFAQTWPSIRRFYLRRAFRILPAYYLSLFLIVLLFQHQYAQPQHWKELGLFFIFFMDSSQATFKQLNAPFWTLAVEWQFYMLLPLLVLAMRQLVWRVKPNRRLITTCSCILALIAWGLFSRYVGTYFMQSHSTATFLLPRSVLNILLPVIYGISGKYLEDFAVGMLIALCFVYAKHATTSPQFRTLLHKLSPWLGSVGLLGLFTMILWSYNQRYANTWPLFNSPLLANSYYLVCELCFSLSFGLCILALLFGSPRLKKPFEWSPLRWLGMISYSLYMWHLPLLIAFIQLGPSLQQLPPALAYGLYWLLVLLLIIPFSFFFFLFVEKPGIKLGEHLQHQKQAATITPPQDAPIPSASKVSAPIHHEINR